MRERQGHWLCFYGDWSLWVNTMSRQEGLPGNQSKFSITRLELLAHTHTYMCFHPGVRPIKHIQRAVCWFDRDTTGQPRGVDKQAHMRVFMWACEWPRCSAADLAQSNLAENHDSSSLNIWKRFLWKRQTLREKASECSIRVALSAYLQILFLF